MKNKKILSFLFSIVMLCAFSGFTTYAEEKPDIQTAKSATVNISKYPNSVFNDLGLSTNQAEINAIINSGEKPTGTTPISAVTKPELSVCQGNGETQVFDLDGKNANLATIISNPSTKDMKSDVFGENIRSVEFDPDGDGRKEHIAYVTADNYLQWDEKCTQLKLHVINGETGEYTEHLLGVYPFHLVPTNAGAFLSITAGDYDGDGKEEIATLSTNLWRDNGILNTNPQTPYEQSVEIYSYNPSEKKLSMKSSEAISCYDFDGKVRTDGRKGLSNLYMGNCYSYKSQMYEYFSVNLANIPGGSGDKDALVVATSYVRGAEKTQNDYAKTYRRYKDSAYLAFWYNPMASDGGKIVRHRLTDSWRDVYGISGSQNSEYMMFPSVAVGDINNDTIPEVLVAGYRMEDATSPSVQGGSLDNRDLDRDRFLITYYSWDGTDFQKACPMQWILHNNKANSTGLGQHLWNNYSDPDYASTPLAMTVFADKGREYYNSVFVAGNILTLPSENDASLGHYSGYQNPPNLNLTVSNADGFRIRYAADLSGYHQKNAAITEAVSGNFDGNPDGREQVIFSYITKYSTSEYWSTRLFRVRAGDNGAYNMNTTLLKEKTTYPPVTVAAPDTDDDSVLLKYNFQKAPAYYFSDPQVVAVLQAAPHFGELENMSDGDPETSMTNSAGSSVGTQHAVEITASAYTAWNPGADIVIGALGVGISANMGGSGGWQHETELTQSVSVTYATNYEDSVVLSSAPYVRYYYEQWCPDKKKWEEAYIDVPLTPRTNMISVDMYDKIAKEAGWKSIRETALFGSVSGRPETYKEDFPGLAAGSWNLTDFKSKKTEWQEVGKGSGSISQTMTHERFSGHGATWGASIGGSVEIRLLVEVGIEVGISYTGGVLFGAYKGTEYSGTVPNIPDPQGANYNFDWQFGTYFVDLFGGGDKDLKAYLHTTDQDKVEDYVTKNNLDCMVIGYKVRNVKRLPSPPDDFAVESTDKNSVTLAWSKVDGAQRYDIAAVSGGNYNVIGTVDAADEETFSFTDTSLSPSTVYQYAVRAYKDVEKLPSLWSEIVTGITAGENGGIAISPQPQDIEVRPGSTAAFTVGVVQEESSYTHNFQWQVRKPERQWENVADSLGTKNTLTLHRVDRSMDGQEYRCVINVRVGGQFYPMYSKPATLTVGSGSTATSLTLNPTSGNATQTVKRSVASNGEYTAGVIVEIGDDAYNLFEYNHAESDANDGFILFREGKYYRPGAEINLQARIDAVANAGVTYGDTFVLEGTGLSAEPIEYERNFYTDEGQTMKFTDYSPDEMFGNYFGPILSSDMYIDWYKTRFPDYNFIDGNLYMIKSDTDVGRPRNELVLGEFNVTRKADGLRTTLYFDWYNGYAGYTQLWLGAPVYKTNSGTIYEDFTESLTPHTVTANGERTIITTETIPGDLVTATATVTENSTVYVTSGTVRFTVADKANGSVAANGNAALDENGIATFTFTAPYAGEFTVTAEYAGAEDLKFSRNTADYTAIYGQEGSKWLTAGANAPAIDYGQSVVFSPALYTVADGAPVPQAVNAVYKVTYGEDVTDLSESLMSGNVFTPCKAGNYTITLTHNDGENDYTAAAVITVGRRSLTVTAQKQYEDSAFDNAAFYFTGILPDDEALARGLFSVELSGREIHVSADTESPEYDLLTEKYNIVTMQGSLIDAIDVQEILLNKSETTLTVGETETLIATVIPVNASYKKLFWTSSNPSVAAVADDGTITGLKAGTADISVTAGDGPTAVCRITVNAEPPVADKTEVTQITLNRTSVTLETGQSLTLTANILPVNATNKTVIWKSGNPEIVSVTGNGTIKGQKAGTAIITASSNNGKTASCTVTVRAPQKPKVRLNVKSARMQRGKSTAAIKASGLIAGDSIKTWSSSRPSIASVTHKGKITAKKTGSARITVKTKLGATATCKIKVVKGVVKTTKITANTKRVTLKKSKSFQLKITRKPITASDKITYKSSNSRIASVNRAGKIKARKKGRCQITIKTSGGKTQKIKVIVK